MALLDSSHEKGVSGDLLFREHLAGAPGQRMLERCSALVSLTCFGFLNMSLSWGMYPNISSPPPNSIRKRARPVKVLFR
jgi:hypothetical protein